MEPTRVLRASFNLDDNLEAGIICATLSSSPKLGKRQISEIDLVDRCRDPQFNLNDFIKSLRYECKSWRRVFWRLWGMVHPLYCSLCSGHFPVYLHEFCSFHPQDPEFTVIQFKNCTEPFGKFPCCGVNVYRYNPLLQSNSRGCQSRDHKVKLRTDGGDTAVYKLLMAHRDAICLTPSKKSGIKISGDANSISLPKPSTAQ